jgi:hypothetical protein
MASDVTMNNKRELITALRDEFERWEEVLAGMSVEEIEMPLTPSYYSTKDDVAHLWAWQQRSIARLEAALYNREPELPQWPVMPSSDGEDNVEQVNQWIYESNKDRSWQSVHEDWRRGFLRFVELAEAIPEEALFAVGKYGWLDRWSLAFVIESSFEHHHVDHLEPLQEWLRQQRETK